MHNITTTLFIPILLMLIVCIRKQLVCKVAQVKWFLDYIYILYSGYISIIVLFHTITCISSAYASPRSTSFWLSDKQFCVCVCVCYAVINKGLIWLDGCCMCIARYPKNTYKSILAGELACSEQVVVLCCYTISFGRSFLICFLFILNSYNWMSDKCVL